VDTSRVEDAAVADLLLAALGGPQSARLEASVPDFAELVIAFYASTSERDLRGRDAADLLGPVISQRELAIGRTPPHGVSRVFTPTVAADGWTCEHTVVEVVADDSPFIVDSVLAALTQAGRVVQLVIHPIINVDGRAESWIHIEIDRESSAEVMEHLNRELAAVLKDVREAVEDWRPMRDQAAEIAAELLAGTATGVAAAGIPIKDVTEAAALLDWLVNDDFTFLGYREYVLEHGTKGVDTLISLPETGLGILRGEEQTRKSFSHLTEEVQKKANERRLLVLTKANRRSLVHRPTYLDYIGVKQFDVQGNVIGEKRFVGLLTAATYADSATAIPVIRQTVARTLAMSNYQPNSHSARDLLHFCEIYPRDELFQVSPRQLLDVARQVLAIGERRETRVFPRNDGYGRFVSILVYLPRDRYTTDVRLAMMNVIEEFYGSSTVDYVARVSESVLARLHFVARIPDGQAIPLVDVQKFEQKMRDASRGWDDNFRLAMQHEVGDENAADLVRQFGRGIPESYKEHVSPRAAAMDIERLADLANPGDSAVKLHDAVGQVPDEHRFTLYRCAEPVALWELLPVFASLGAELQEQRPFEIVRDDGQCNWVYDVGIRLPGKPAEVSTADHATRFCDAFLAAWRGRCEIDILNALVPSTVLTWREVSWLRSWSQYAHQLGSHLSSQYSQNVLLANGSIACQLVGLFRARLDPAMSEEERDQLTVAIDGDISSAVDAVESLDADRILRQLHEIVRAVLRTNAFQLDDNGDTRPTLAIKLAPETIPGVPQPRPHVEIWVSSPRLSAVHLRFGPISRGGVRWSDRPEDMRTEILGLAKAQMVKNAVIVPVGAKGGFYVKNPRNVADRGAYLEDGIARYREFITALLQLTDNRVDGQIVGPKRTVRLDGDDPYLVVAADKGTASFSDIANQISLDQGFWLGDAFASGGSHGYDHKAMGITARGAWESVKRHFREIGIDIQAEPVTVVGIGDMSGDVFGNGMLLSEQIQLVAAFDHRHIFLDPNPRVDMSYAERARLAALPGSSWADYNPELISSGGGVYSRDLKAIPVSDEVRDRLGIGRFPRTLTPSHLMRAILSAPVDLFWNGGIGTYVKSSAESNADVGDKANDAIRVNGDDLRVRVVGEGGNLGLTQPGRIEAARAGVQLNTDAIDNSAGVDCSDHEVNIKILLDAVVADGDLTFKQRNELLVEMTNDVSTLVLADNYAQNQVLGYARAQAAEMLPVHERLIHSLEARGLLNRDLEDLPSDAQIAQLKADGQGLTSPSLCVLLSYVKIALTTDLSDSGLATEEFFSSVLCTYFPPAMVERFGNWLAKHPLRDAIITTVVANVMVDTGGISYVHRTVEETGASPIEIVRAYSVVREVFSLDRVWEAISALDGTVPTQAQTALHLEVRRLLDRATRWVLSLRGGTVHVAEEIEQLKETIAGLEEVADRLLVGSQRVRYREKLTELTDLGAPAEIARLVATALDRFSMLDIDSIARRQDVPAADVAELYFAVAERYGFDALLHRISGLPRSDRWANLARAALRSDLYAVLAGLTSKILRSTDQNDVPESRIADWEERNAEGQQRARSTLRELDQVGNYDLATLSVALRVLRTLVQQSSTTEQRSIEKMGS
jgi:glutamate dehydrogenase